MQNSDSGAAQTAREYGSGLASACSPGRANPELNRQREIKPWPKSQNLTCANSSKNAATN